MFRTDSTMTSTTETARQFVQARLTGRALPVYPGQLPTSAEQAYACQDAAIALWPEPVVGWKVGWVPAEAQATFGAPRLVGPVFSGLLRQYVGPSTQCPVFSGGFAAVEAEFVFRLAQDAPANQHDWTPQQAATLVDRLYTGIEIASSPFAGINALGPMVTASDFGNHFGLLIGPEIVDWEMQQLDSLHVDVTLNGKLAGRGTAASIPGGPLTALAFALGVCARRSMPLKAGQYVCTGAATGVHSAQVGDRAVVQFHEIATMACELVPAQSYEIRTKR